MSHACLTSIRSCMKRNTGKPDRQLDIRLHPQGKWEVLQQKLQLCYAKWEAAILNFKLETQQGKNPRN